MRIIYVDLKTVKGKRLKATASVILDNGRRLGNIKVVNVKNEYRVIAPSKKEAFDDMSGRGPGKHFCRIIRDYVLNEYICAMARSMPFNLWKTQKETFNTYGGML